MAYLVKPSRNAQAEILDAYEWMQANDPTRADRWYNGLIDALASLEHLPTRCSFALENALFTQEIRQLLYGKGQNVYRILFTVRE